MQDKKQTETKPYKGRILFPAKKYGIPVFLFMLLAIRFFSPLLFLRVSGESMIPSYEDGDILFMTKTRGKEISVNRFDIVTADIPDYPTDVIKRIIGLPGETVILDGETVYIENEDGRKELSGLYGYENGRADRTDPKNHQQITLKEDEYFLMGDNVNHSSDSRDFGPVSYERIFGYKTEK